MISSRGVQPVDPRKLRWILYGATGTGKTTFAGSIPGAVVLDLERGSHSVDCERIDVDDWRGFNEAIGSIMGRLGDKSAPSCVVIDTMDRLRSLSVAANNGGQWPANVRQWGAVNMPIRALIERLCRLPLGVVFVSWERTAVLDQDGREYPIGVEPPKNAARVVMPSCTGATTVEADRFADVVARTVRDGARCGLLCDAGAAGYYSKDRTNLMPPGVDLNWGAVRAPFVAALRSEPRTDPPAE